MDEPYIHTAFFFLIDENQTNLWWRSLATFDILRRQQEGLKDLPAHKFPLLVDQSLPPSWDAILLIEDYLPKAFPNITGRSIAHSACNIRNIFFFFLLEVCKKHFDYFLILAMNILYLNEILKPIYNYYMIKIWVMIEHTCFKARTPGFKSHCSLISCLLAGGYLHLNNLGGRQLST